MGFFKDLGKAIGGIASKLVPGFGLLASTGIMGDDLAAMNGAPTTSAVQATVASSPTMLANTIAPPAPPAGPFIPAVPSNVFRVGAAPAALSGRTINIPVEYVQALGAAARGGLGVPSGVGALPGAALTPLQQVRKQLPTTGIPPNILSAAVFNW